MISQKVGKIVSFLFVVGGIMMSGHPQIGPLGAFLVYLGMQIRCASITDKLTLENQRLRRRK